MDYIGIPPESGNVVDTKIISMHNSFVKEQSLLQEMTVLHTLTTSCWITFQVMYVFTNFTDLNAVTDPRKFLNSLELSRMPPHILKLKVGAPVMVLQNINPLYLYNGTQCIVRILGTIALK